MSSGLHRWRPLLAAALLAGPLQAQSLSLEQARARALAASPELAAAREVIRAAEGRQRQAGAFPNPVIAYSREETSGGGQTSWQNIALVEQRLDVGGARGARREAGSFRVEAARARLVVLESETAWQVAKAYATAQAADRQAELAAVAAEAFARADRVTTERLARGDVSGYEGRRIGLEAARYAALHARAVLDQRRARLALAVLLAPGPDSVVSLSGVPLDPPGPVRALPELDSLHALATRHRAEVRELAAEGNASAADARAASREAFPGPLAGLGYKNEGASGIERRDGFVIQVAVPLPLWDARKGVSQAFEAEAGQRAAEQSGLRKRLVREVQESWDAVAAVRAQLETLRPRLGEEAAAALRAAEAAYREGEISLVAWLDAVRVYQEAESTYATLQAEYLTQHAALERAVGMRLP